MSGSSSAGRAQSSKKLHCLGNKHGQNQEEGGLLDMDMALPEVMEEGNKAISAPNTCTGDKNIVTH